MLINNVCFYICEFLTPNMNSDYIVSTEQLQKLLKCKLKVAKCRLKEAQIK